MKTGLLGSVRWRLIDNTLLFEPQNGNEGTFTKNNEVLKTLHSIMFVTRVEHIKTKGILHCKGKVLEKMFAMFIKLKTADLSAFETSKVRSMNSMFCNCHSLQALDISSFDTANVRDMHGMFSRCENLKTLDLSHFDTSKVTNMSCMFEYCSKLLMLDLSNFNTTKVKHMWGMFEGCFLLETLNLSSFNTRNVEDMSSMFRCCENLKALDLSNFDTSKLSNMGFMFRECKTLKELDLSNFNIRNDVHMAGAFHSCDNLERIDFSQFNPKHIKEDYDFGLWKCPVLKEIIIPDKFEKRYEAFAPLYLCDLTTMLFHKRRLLVKLLTKIEEITGTDFAEEKKLLSIVTLHDCNEIGEWKAHQRLQVDNRLSAIFEIIEQNGIAIESLLNDLDIESSLNGLGINGVSSDIQAYLSGVPVEDILA